MRSILVLALLLAAFSGGRVQSLAADQGPASEPPSAHPEEPEVIPDLDEFDEATLRAIARQLYRANFELRRQLVERDARFSRVMEEVRELREQVKALQAPAATPPDDPAPPAGPASALGPALPPAAAPNSQPTGSPVLPPRPIIGFPGLLRPSAGGPGMPDAWFRPPHQPLTPENADAIQTWLRENIDGKPFQANIEFRQFVLHEVFITGDQVTYQNVTFRFNPKLRLTTEQRRQLVDLGLERGDRLRVTGVITNPRILNFEDSLRLGRRRHVDVSFSLTDCTVHRMTSR